MVSVSLSSLVGVALLLVFMLVASSCVVHANPASTLAENCRPQRKMNQAQCLRRIRACASVGIDLKWTGKGCRGKGSQAKKFVGDGGCQCSSYCGYTCSKACTADRSCKWNLEQNMCYTQGGVPGLAIPNCTTSAPTSMAPTTLTPSSSPTLTPTNAPTSVCDLPSNPSSNIIRDAAVPGGWTLCYQDTYNIDITPQLASINASCVGSLMMLACRPVGATLVTLAAWANKTDVMFDTGTSNTPHDANGVSWYFSPAYSWGFAQVGTGISRDSCDTGSTEPCERLCWHTGSSGGYRCGSVLALNGATTWERLVYYSN